MVYSDTKSLQSVFRTILLEHAEVALHEFYGNQLYWEARRSMRFSTKLKSIANDFRKSYLNSYDTQDKTVQPDNWKDEQVMFSSLIMFKIYFVPTVAKKGC